MKAYKTPIVTLILTAFALALAGIALAVDSSGVAIPPPPKFNKSDAKKYGRALADYADTYNAGWKDSYGKSRMTLISADGDQVQRDISQMVLEGRDGNKALLRFLSPADIRGVSALIHEHPNATDDSWLYLPASRRVRRISGANRAGSFQGTEFTYEDLSAIEPSRYDWKFLRDEKLSSSPLYVLEARPNYNDTGYSKLIVYMHEEHWRVEKTEYFDKAGKKLKTLTMHAWKHHHGRFWRAHKLDMNNHQTKKRTVLQTKSLFLNLSLYKRKDGTLRKSLSKDQFSRRALENR